MANRRALDGLIAPEHQWPVDRSNPIYEHLGAWWDNSELVQRCFGGRLSGLDQVRRASQHLQHDGLRYVVESRLRHAPRTSGVLPWQFNEPYPNAWCTSAVDYWGDPKPAYYGVKRAYRASHTCAAFSTWAWAGRDYFRADVHAWPGPAVVEARALELSGLAVASERYQLGAPGGASSTTVPGGVLSFALAAIEGPIFLLDLVARATAGPIATNRYVLSTTADLAPLLDLAPARLEAS